MYNTLEEALAAADMKQLVDAAKSKGYNPTKEKAVTDNRNQLISQKVKAEHDLEEANAKVKLLSEQNSESKKKLEELDKIKSQHANIEKDLEELKGYREASKKATDEAKKALEAKKKAWETADKDSIVAIPEYDDPKKTLDWMSKFEKRFFPDGITEQQTTDENTKASSSPVDVPNQPPKKQGNYPERIVNQAKDRGISPEMMMKIDKIENPPKETK